MSTLNATSLEQIGDMFRVLSQPSRLRILVALGSREACVCHLEASLGYRQAYLSQQLMVLREAGVVVTRRNQKHIYYSLTNPEVLTLVEKMGEIIGYPLEWMESVSAEPLESCSCPHCQAAQVDGEKNFIEER